MNNTKMILIPLNIDLDQEDKEQFLIWEKQEGDVDTFRVPLDAELNMPTAFWQAEVGVVAFGKVASAVFVKEDRKDRNDQKHVAEVEISRIFYNHPIKSKEISSQVRQSPVYIYSDELMKCYLQ